MRRGIVIASGILAALFGGCGEEAPALPEGIQTLKFRTIRVAPTDELAPPVDRVRALNGMHGAPEPVVPGDADLRTLYWGRTAGSPEPDGAHVGLVRLGTDTVCGVSLDGIFPDGSADPDDPSSYDFSILDERVASIRELNTARILWQAAFNPGRGACSADEGGTQLGDPVDPGDAERWATVAVNTLRHLRDGDAWDPDGHRYDVPMVEFLDDPIGRMGYTDEDVDDLFAVYETFASRVKARWPDGDGGPTVAVGGLSFTLEHPDDLDWTRQDDKHPILRFVDFSVAGGVPLDFLAFRTRTTTPEDAAEIAAGLRAYLDDHPQDQAGRYADTELVVSGVRFQDEEPQLTARGILDGGPLENAYLGAFQSSARILMQDVPVRHLVAGRGPRVFDDLGSHAGEDRTGLVDRIVESDYFDADAVAKPAFMALFPFRQVGGHQRVRVTNRADMAVLASHAPGSDRVLHVIIANANVLAGEEGLNAFVTYDLRLEQFVPASVPRVEYKLAVLGQGAFGTGSFSFTEVGSVGTLRGDGTVSFVHDMAVPSVHYLQFVKPDPAEN